MYVVLLYYIWITNISKGVRKNKSKLYPITETFSWYLFYLRDIRTQNLVAWNFSQLLKLLKVFKIFDGFFNFSECAIAQNCDLIYTEKGQVLHYHYIRSFEMTKSKLFVSKRFD